MIAKNKLLITVILVLILVVSIVYAASDCDDCEADEICVIKKDKEKCKTDKDKYIINDNGGASGNIILYGALIVNGEVIYDDECCYLDPCNSGINDDIDSCDCVYNITC